MAVPYKTGRPTLYREEYCEQVIEHMAQGYSFESFAAVIGTHRDTLYEWCDKHEEFSDARKNAQMVSQYFWEKIGVAGMLGKLPGFNTGVWVFNMKNRFNWTDKREDTSKLQISHSFGQPTLEELKKALEKDNVIQIEKKDEETK